MRKLFLSLVFLSVLLSIHANPGIKGIVIDQTTRKALDYAHVVLYDRDHIVEEAMTERFFSNPARKTGNVFDPYPFSGI